MSKKKKAEKFFFEVTDDVDEAHDSIREAEGEVVVLNIPRDSVLGKSVKNFRFLKKKANDVGKELRVESVDDHILELANVADIECVNPIFQTAGRAVVDIVPGGSRERTDADAVHAEEEEGGKNAPAVTGMVEDDEKSEARPRRVRGTKRSRAKRRIKLPFPKMPLVLPAPRMAVRFGILALVLAFAGLGLVRALPRATVALELKRFPIAFTKRVKADTSIAEPSIAGETVFLPGELLTAKKNISLEFPATAEDSVEQKAHGKITIFNEFSSEPQVLVATTRFETPDGKVYRIPERITVPGAKVSDGQIQTSSVEVEVFADEPGEEFNIGPVDAFTIPGFKGSPRFEGFFARSFAPMTGGFLGVQKVATDEDVAAAREKAKSKLLDVLKSEIAILMSDRFEVLDKTTSFQVVKEEVLQPEPDGNAASIFVEAEMRQFVFDRSHLEDQLTAYARKSLPQGMEFAVVDMSVEYEDVALNLGAERADFKAKGDAVFTANVDTDGLAASLLGKTSEDVKRAIYELPGLDRAKLSLWPFWVKKVPKNEKKLKIEVR